VNKRTKQTIVISAMAATLAIGVGAGVASGGLGFGNDQQAFLDNAAKRLNVTPAELKAALQGAYSDQLDAAVAAGKITKAQADAMKQHSTEGGLPLFGGGHRGNFGHHGPPSLAAAATYLGLTEAELRTELESGKNLAQIATAQGKTVADLKKALAAATRTKLDAAVKAGQLTQAQADELQTRMTEHLDDLVNGRGGPGGDHDGHGWGGPPPPGGSLPTPAFVPVAPAGSTA
jgi:hypothetical protein